MARGYPMSISPRGSPRGGSTRQGGNPEWTASLSAKVPSGDGDQGLTVLEADSEPPGHVHPPRVEEGGSVPDEDRSGAHPERVHPALPPVRVAAHAAVSGITAIGIPRALRSDHVHLVARECAMPVYPSPDRTPQTPHGLRGLDLWMPLLPIEQREGVALTGSAHPLATRLVH